MSSDDDDTADLIASFKKAGSVSAKKKPSSEPGEQPRGFVSQQKSEDDRSKRPPRGTRRRVIAVRPSPVRNRDEYVYYEPKETAECILREYQRKGELRYDVKLVGGGTKEVRLSAK